VSCPASPSAAQTPPPSSGCDVDRRPTRATTLTPPQRQVHPGHRAPAREPHPLQQPVGGVRVEAPVGQCARGRHQDDGAQARLGQGLGPQGRGAPRQGRL
jgi:hypothetical protein